MISIIEGKPGTGKTYFAVTKIVSYLQEGRDVQTNIEINLDLLPEGQSEHLHELETTSANWYQKTLEGAVVFVDEFQNIEKDDAREIKKFQQYLSTHRHRRQDWYLISQSYMNISVNTRRYCERVESLLNIKSLSLPWPLSIKGDDLQTFLEGWGIDRQVVRVRRGLLSLNKAEWEEDADVFTITPEIGALYNSQTLSLIKEDRPAPIEKGDKKGAVLWLFKRYWKKWAFRVSYTTILLGLAVTTWGSLKSGSLTNKLFSPKFQAQKKEVEEVAGDSAPIQQHKEATSALIKATSRGVGIIKGGPINEEGKIGFFDVKKNIIRGKNEYGDYYEEVGRARIMPSATLSSDGVRDFDPRKYKGLSFNE